VQLSSKVGRVRGSAPHPFAGRRIHHQLEQSLENLYAEQLDLYTLDSMDFGPADRYLGNAVDVMRTLRDLESIKAIGLRGPHVNGTESPAAWRQRADRFLRIFLLIKPDVVWLPFNAYTPLILLDSEDLLSFISRSGAGLVLAVSGVGEAAATGLRALDDHSRSSVSTMTRVALHACLRRFPNSAAVVRFRNHQLLEAAFDRLAAPATAQEIQLLEERYFAVRTQLMDRVCGDAVQSLLGSGPWIKA
jgi:aryl-alcohol dehydrogenase-like predicted oxidoreductase